MTVSTQGRAAAYAQETGEAWVTLLALSHPKLDGVVRLSTAGQLIVHQGQTYFPVPFQCDLVADSDDEVPQTRLSMDILSDDIRQALELIDSPADVTITVVLGSQPDVIEEGPLDLQLSDLEWDETLVTGTLTFEPGLQFAYPSHSYTPTTARGMF